MTTLHLISAAIAIAADRAPAFAADLAALCERHGAGLTANVEDRQVQEYQRQAAVSLSAPMLAWLRTAAYGSPPPMATTAALIKRGLLTPDQQLTDDGMVALAVAPPLDDLVWADKDYQETLRMIARLTEWETIAECALLSDHSMRNHAEALWRLGYVRRAINGGTGYGFTDRGRALVWARLGAALHELPAPAPALNRNTLDVIRRICPECGTPFTVPRKRGRPRTYCGATCAERAKTRNEAARELRRQQGRLKEAA